MKHFVEIDDTTKAGEILLGVSRAYAKKIKGITIESPETIKPINRYA